MPTESVIKDLPIDRLKKELTTALLTGVPTATSTTTIIVARTLATKLVELLSNNSGLLTVAKTAYKELDPISSCEYYQELLGVSGKGALATRERLATLLRINTIATVVVGEQERIAALEKFRPVPHFPHMKDLNESSLS